MIDSISANKILPAVNIPSPEVAIPIATALNEGGLTVMEITFRNEYAATCIDKIVSSGLTMNVGAGTLLTPDQVQAAQDAGATFGVSPGFNPKVVKKANEIGFPLYPGVMTPGEIEQAIDLGCKAVKIFPVSQLGGSKFVKAIDAPYKHTGIKFIPFGGINEGNLKEYFGFDSVIAVGGSWLVTQTDCDNKDWVSIQEKTSNTKAILKRL